MNNNRPTESSGSITLGDVYFVIFRHKWKIMIISLAGIVAAATYYFLNPPLYQSEAQLFIRYITEEHPVTAPTDNATTIATSGRDSGVINAELKILYSWRPCKAGGDNP